MAESPPTLTARKGVPLALWMNTGMGDTSVPTYSPDAVSTSCVDNCTRLVVRSMPGCVGLTFTVLDRTDRQTDDYPSVFDVAYPGTPNVTTLGGENFDTGGTDVCTANRSL